MQVVEYNPTIKSMTTQHKRSGFSLIELLVVVTTIAVLSSLVLVVIAQVRASAHQVVCANNLRNLGVYAQGYAADRNGMGAPAHMRWWLGWNGYAGNYTKGKIPHEDVWGDPWNFWTYYLGYQQFAMEDGNNGNWFTAYSSTNPTGRWAWIARNVHLFQCPSAPVQFLRLPDPPPSGWGKRDLITSSYGMNSAYLGQNGSILAAGWLGAHGEMGADGWPGYGIGIPGVQDKSRRYAKISRPSETIQIAEHVGDVTNPFTTITDPPFVQDPRGADSAALPVPGDFGTRIGPFTNPGWQVTSMATRASHRNQGNFLFVDGRVALLSPWRTCKADYGTENMWTGR